MSLFDDIFKGLQEAPARAAEITLEAAKRFVRKRYPGAVAYMDEDHHLKEARWHVWDDMREKGPNPILGSGYTPEEAWEAAAIRLDAQN